MEQPNGKGAAYASVLVVDDESAILDTLRILLRKEGFDPHVAHGGRKGLELLGELHPDIVLTDIRMPNVDGVEVLRRRRERELATRTRVLVLTAKTDTRDAVWCWELGADDYLTKPVDPDRLAREVRKLMDRTPQELRHRREVGLADARERDRIEQAFSPD